MTTKSCKWMESLPIFFFLEKQPQYGHLIYPLSYFPYLILWHLKFQSGFYLKLLVVTINPHHIAKRLLFSVTCKQSQLTCSGLWNKRESYLYPSSLGQWKVCGYLYISLPLVAIWEEALFWAGVSKDRNNLVHWVMLLNRTIWKLFGHGIICGSKTKQNSTKQTFIFKPQTIHSSLFLLINHLILIDM